MIKARIIEWILRKRGIGWGDKCVKPLDKLLWKLY